ncbi:hypothetical protein PspLS_08246 [Pyricularia sp. CBS 133598]|nr:hypothetical protein PspLS_08246 [Pyricularia sp. CBS 133598]
MDDGFDPEAFYALQRSMYVDKLTYTPKPALVIEVYKSVVGPPYFLAAKRTAEELDDWIRTQVTRDKDGFSRPGLRLIIGGARDAEPKSKVVKRGPPFMRPAGPPRRVPGPPPPVVNPPPAPAPGLPPPASPPQAPSPIPEGCDSRWPNDQKNLDSNRYQGIGQCIPFSTETLERITTSFGLPTSTHWLFQTNDIHFKRYRMRRSVIGLTARYFYNKSLDVALSMSYCPETDITTALMVGPTVRQTEFLRAQVCKLARIAHHPALVPTLMAESARNVMVYHVRSVSTTITQLETSYRHIAPISICTQVVNITKDLALTETELEMLETQRAATVDLVHLTSDGGPRSEKGKERSRADIVEIGLVLEERLDFLASTTKHPRLKVRMYKERSQAMFTLAASPNSTPSAAALFQIRSTLDEQLRRSTTRFWWFRAVVLTVITFTPGIFAATLFSTSFMSAANPPQWTFWATAAPLTVGVLVALAIWRFWQPPWWLSRWPDMASWMRQTKRKVRRRFGLSDDSSTSTGSTSLVEDD